MPTHKSFCICGMCTACCPIQVETEHGEIKFIEGNQNVLAMNGAVCPRAQLERP